MREHHFRTTENLSKTTCVNSEQYRSFSEAEYFLLDRGIDGLTI